MHIEHRAGFVIVSSGEELLAVECEEIENALQSDPGLDNADAVVLDLGRCKVVDRALFRMIAKLGLDFKRTGKPFFAVEVPSTIRKLIRDQGLDGTIRIFATIEVVSETLKQPASPNVPKLEVAFINPFIDSTLKTLSIQCSTEVRAGKPRLKGDTTPCSVDIAGVIGLTSAAFNGSIALCFPERTFLSIMEGMLGERFETINRDLEDGAGELLNIIFGQAKIVLNQIGYGIEKALPTVVRGSALQVRHMTAGPAIVIPFESSNGAFFIEVGLEGPGVKG